MVGRKKLIPQETHYLGPTDVFSLSRFTQKAHKISPVAFTYISSQKQIEPMESRQFVESNDASSRVARTLGFVQYSSKVTSLEIASIKIFLFL